MRILTILLSIMLFTLPVQASYLDTGWFEFEQPDGVKFVGRYWGDEFFNWFETEDGYRFVGHPGGWYTYAILDENGEFTSSGLKVGMDTPRSESYQLERSEERKSEIESQIEEFNNGIDIASQIYEDKRVQAGERTVEYKLGIVLVSFADTEPAICATTGEPYIDSDFENLLFSSGHLWHQEAIYDPVEEETLLPSDMYPEDEWVHPEGQAIYGSLRDYYNEISAGQFDFEDGSGIINDIDADGYPIFWQLPHNKIWYHETPDGEARDWGFALREAIDEFNLNSIKNNGGYHAIAVIYAEDHWYNQGLTTCAIPPYYYIFAEQDNIQREIGVPHVTVFAHMGTHTHEFGHVLGLHHTKPTTESYHWNTMGYGNMNGPNAVFYDGSCPARVNALYCVIKGWYDTLVEINQNVLDLEIAHDYFNPTYYKIPISNSNQYFVLETRLREGFDKYTGNNPEVPSPYPNDPNDNIGGLLIWQHSQYNPDSCYEPQLQLADNQYFPDQWVHHDTEAGDPFPWYQGQDFNDITEPSARMLVSAPHSSRDQYFIDGDTPSHIAIQNIRWNSVDNTAIVDIYTNAWTGELSGDISDNRTLYNDIQLTDDLNVQQGAILNVLPGTQISLNNYDINVQGQLICASTSSNPITINSNSSTGQINLIGSAIPSYFEHVNFENTLLYYEPTANSEGYIDNCHFLSTGIIMINNSIGVMNSIFEDCQFGIIGFASAPNISNCTFSVTSQAIVAWDNSDPKITGCVIDGNRSGIGLDVNYGSMPNLSKQDPSEWACDRDNNLFHNCFEAVRAEGNSYPELGGPPGIIGDEVFYGGCGWNRFYDNTVDVFNDNEGAIWAIANNWYETPPGSQNYCENSEPGVIIGEVLWEPTVFDLVGNNSGDPPRSKESDGDYQGAIADYKQIVESAPDSSVAVKAIYDLSRVYRIIHQIDELISVMENYANTYPGTKVLEHALSQAATHRISFSSMNDLALAQSNIDQLRQVFPNTELDLKLLYEEALIAGMQNSNNLGRIGSGAKSESGIPIKAVEKYEQILEQYPETPVAILARLALGNYVTREVKPNMLPSNFCLHTNYPNPFNPITTLTFGLPEISDVTLVIYDLRGREVITLVDEQINPGAHNKVWKGIDSQGRPIPSGMYIYRIIATSLESDKQFTQSLKMVLLK